MGAQTAGRTPLAISALVAIALSSSAMAQPAPQGDPEAARRAQEAQNARPNTPGDGPYPAILETDPAFPGHVIYRPADLTPFAGGKLPVLVWGNGGCADDGTAHRFHLAQIASYGYLVIAAGAWRSGPGATEPRPPRPAPTAAGAPAAGAPQGGLPPAATSAEDVRAGIDWAMAQNARAGGKLQGRVATQSVAAAGHSCGGLQAIEVGADLRVKTVLVHNSGIFNDGGQGRGIPGMTVSKSALNSVHTPIIYIQGGPTDIAYENGKDDFARISHVPVVLADLPVGHGGTFSQPMGGAVAHVAVDWLDWQLKGDRTAARTFTGENCRLCAGTDWSIERKGL